MDFFSFFFGECRYKRKKFRLRSLVGKGYIILNVTQNLFETFAIFFQRHLLASQPELVECVKKYGNNLVIFAILHRILWFVTHVTKSVHFSLSSPYSVLPLLCIKKMRKFYSLTSFEVDELLLLPRSWETRFPSQYLCGE